MGNIKTLNWTRKGGLQGTGVGSDDISDPLQKPPGAEPSTWHMKEVILDGMMLFSWKFETATICGF